MLQARGLQVRFGGFVAINDLSLDVLPGTIHAVIGPNGAGKTTLFNALTGVRPPQRGDVRFAGRAVTGMAVHRRVALGMARSFQVTNLFADFTVEENLRLAVQAVPARAGWVFWRRAGGAPGEAARVDELLETVGLTRERNKRAGDLSHGAQRALEIGMALAADPKLIFLDEPLAGMGVDDIDRARALIHGLAPRRTAVLIEHNMSVVLDISDRITVLAQGRRIAEGTPAAIRADPAVRAAYLGSTA